MVYRLVSLLGLLVFIGLAWLCSENRRKVSWTLVAKGLVLQFALAAFILLTPIGRATFEGADAAIRFVLNASSEGTKFVFGPLADGKIGFVFFVQITGTIILVSSLMSVLYYLRIMQWVVWGMAKVMQVVMGTSGSESLAAAANVFVGQTEAPLVIRPYLERMTRSELMALMTGGMATIAGGVMAVYVGMLSPMFPDIAGHLLTASVLSAPASLVMAKIMVPETQPSETAGQVRMDFQVSGTNLLDAACQGASEGLTLSLNVMAMLIAFIALVFLANSLLGYVGTTINYPLSLERILGWLFSPMAIAMGVPVEESPTVGALLGERIILNEFVAYAHLGDMLRLPAVQSATLAVGTPASEPSVLSVVTTAQVAPPPALSRRSTIIASYALCGFANFASIAIQIGGIGTLVPSRRSVIAKLGFRSMIAGMFASFMTANIAGVLID